MSPLLDVKAGSFGIAAKYKVKADDDDENGECEEDGECDGELDSAGGGYWRMNPAVGDAGGESRVFLADRCRCRGHGASLEYIQ